MTVQRAQRACAGLQGGEFVAAVLARAWGSATSSGVFGVGGLTVGGDTSGILCPARAGSTGGRVGACESRPVGRSRRLRMVQPRVRRRGGVTAVLSHGLEVGMLIAPLPEPCEFAVEAVAAVGAPSAGSLRRARRATALRRCGDRRRDLCPSRAHDPLRGALEGTQALLGSPFRLPRHVERRWAPLGVCAPRQVEIRSAGRPRGGSQEDCAARARSRAGAGGPRRRSDRCTRL